MIEQAEIYGTGPIPVPVGGRVGAAHILESRSGRIDAGAPARALSRRRLLGLTGVLGAGAALALGRGAPWAGWVRGSAPTPELDLPVGPAAPEVVVRQWIGTRPPARAALRGSVVGYYFWAFQSVNCGQALPYVQAWSHRYARDGLILIGIHTPAVAAEADARNVLAYVRANGIDFPVALDPGAVVWRAFGNEVRPAVHLYDRSGRRRLVQRGTGDYAHTEDAMRSLLGVDADSPRAGG